MTYTTLQLRRDTDANWTSADPVLAEGEIGMLVDGSGDVTSFKIGNGTDAWSALTYFSPGGVGPQGPAGSDGSDGLSAYQIAVAGGFVGTESQWLDSLVATFDLASSQDGIEQVGSELRLDIDALPLAPDV